MNLFGGHLVSFLFAVICVQYLLLSRKCCVVLLLCFDTLSCRSFLADTKCRTYEFV